MRGRTERLLAKNHPSGVAADPEPPGPRVGLLGPTTSNPSPPPDLAKALEQCRSAARRGYEIAKENLRELARAIGDVSKSLSLCLKKLEDGSVRTPGIVDQLKRQLSGVVNELEQLQRTSDFALEERRKRLDSFSVSLFGRTMAGKSTVMEILTRGDGQSIGTWRAAHNPRS